MPTLADLDSFFAEQKEVVERGTISLDSYSEWEQSKLKHAIARRYVGKGVRAPRRERILALIYNWDVYDFYHKQLSDGLNKTAAIEATAAFVVG